MSRQSDQTYKSVPPANFSVEEFGLLLRRFKNLKLREKIWLVENLAKTDELLIEHFEQVIRRIYYGIEE